MFSADRMMENIRGRQRFTEEDAVSTLINAATQLRGLQLYSHAAHNLTKGPSFFADHAFLGDLYKAYEDAYDSVIERAIGTYDLPQEPIAEIQKIAANLASSVSLDSLWETLLSIERILCAALQEAVAAAGSEGTKQLLGEICNQAEIRQYKIKQRIK